MAESNSEQQITSEEDRISSLPDDVLNHILSCLPTKTVVATCCLSRRWRHLWQHVSVLDFTDSEGLFQQRANKFRRFALLVNGVLATFPCNLRPIRKFRLWCSHSFLNDKFRACSVDTWVRTAIALHPEELDLDLVCYIFHHCYKLPVSIFTSTNLVTLRLHSDIDLNVQSSTSVTLTSLKKLVINIYHVEVSSLNLLLCGCPNIEILYICSSTHSLDKICVPPSLKRLTIDIENELGAYLEINAPDLKYLDITRITFGEVISMHKLHNVVEAHLDVFPQSSGSVIPLNNLLVNLSQTKHLVLSRSTTKWLLGEPHDLTFQEFRYLLRLEITLGWFNSISLLNLLHKCPMLQVLIIQNDKEQSTSLLGWVPTPACVPKCLISHLTIMQFKGFQGFSDEVSFVEHVLQIGIVLKKVIIAADNSLYLKDKHDILKTLSDVPRASPMCQLKFD